MKDYRGLTNIDFRANLTMIHEQNRLTSIHVEFNDTYPDVFIQQTANSFDIRQHIHEVEKDPLQYKYLMHDHNCFLLVWARDGDNTEIVEDEVFVMNRDDLLLLSPNTKHYNFTKSMESTVIFFNLLPSMLAKTILPLLDEEIVFSDFLSEFMTDGSTHRYMLLRNSVTPDTEWLLNAMIDDVVQKPPFYKNHLRLLFTTLLIEIARQPGINRLNESTNQRIRSILHYLSQSTTDISLEEIARKFNYNPAYLSDLIKRETGKNFHQLKEEYRMSKALAYLSTTNLTVEQIAHQCGYSDKSTFYRAFRRHFDRTPRKRNVK